MKWRWVIKGDVEVEQTHQLDAVREAMGAKFAELFEDHCLTMEVVQEQEIVT